MFALSAGPGAFQVWLDRREADGAYWMVVGVPALAALIFAAFTGLVPALLGSTGLKFPRQLTLPLVFTALLPTCAALWLTTPQEFVSSFDVVRFAQVWEQPAELMIALGAQMLGISLLALLRQVQ